MKRIMKKTISLALALSMLLALLSFVGCGEQSEIEPKIDEILTSSSYTVKITQTDSPNVTFMVSDMEIYILEETKEYKAEQFLFESGGKKYHVVTVENKEGEVETKKTELSKSEYLEKYISVVENFAPNDILFAHKNVLQMAEKVEENHYRYSDNVYEAGFSSKTGYIIKLDGGALTFIKTYEDSRENKNRTEVVYSDVGNTTVKIPMEIKNLK